MKSEDLLAMHKKDVKASEMSENKSKKDIKILVATDGSEYAKKGLDYALSLALMNNGEIILLHVIPYVPESPPPLWASPKVEERDKKYVEKLYKEAEKLIEEEVNRIKNVDVKIKTVVEFGEPAEKILDVTEKLNVDLVVIGVIGKSKWKKVILGSVSDEVLDRAKVPVMIIR